MKDRSSKGQLPPPPPALPSEVGRPVDRRVPQRDDKSEGGVRRKLPAPPTDWLLSERRRDRNSSSSLPSLSLPPPRPREAALLDAMRLLRPHPLPRFVESATPLPDPVVGDPPIVDSEPDDPAEIDERFARARNVPRLHPPGRTLDTEGGVKRFNLPMICARQSRNFALRFRKGKGRSESSWQFESAITDLAGAGEDAMSLAVPVESISFSRIKCPFCRSACAPIRCGRCQRLVCSGSIRKIGDHEFFTCVPTCGGSGIIHLGLSSVTGFENREAPRAGSRALVCVPIKPPEVVPKTAKPR